MRIQLFVYFVSSLLTISKKYLWGKTGRALVGRGAGAGGAGGVALLAGRGGRVVEGRLAVEVAKCEGESRSHCAKFRRQCGKGQHARKQAECDE